MSPLDFLQIILVKTQHMIGRVPFDLNIPNRYPSSHTSISADPLVSLALLRNLW